MIHRRPLLAAAAGFALASARPAHAAENMVVILDWLMNPNHAALFAADHTGAFSRAGLSVKLVAPSDPDSPVRLAAAGQADLAVSYGTQINLIDSAGLPLLRVASLIDTPLNTVTALGGGSIRTLADLKGKKIGVSVGGVEDAVLYVMLDSVGLAPTDVTPVKVNYGMVPALLSGGLDAAIGAYRNAEVLQIRAMGRTPLVFLPEEHGVPLYDELILVTKRDRASDPRIKRFVAALHEGTTALLRAPDAMWQAFAQTHPELATPLNQASWKATMPAIAPEPGKLDSQRYLKFQAFAVAHGIARKSMPIGDFAVDMQS
jgi:putative hydroxymethylpyrimidine transport system substrate-binding protein